MDSEENKISKFNEMGMNIAEHLAHTATPLDDDDDGDIKSETLVVDLENKKEPSRIFVYFGKHFHFWLNLTSRIFFHELKH